MIHQSSWLSAPREGWTAAQEKRIAEMNAANNNRVGMGITVGWSLPKKVKR